MILVLAPKTQKKAIEAQADTGPKRKKQVTLLPLKNKTPKAIARAYFARLFLAAILAGAYFYQDQVKAYFTDVQDHQPKQDTVIKKQMSKPASSESKVAPISFGNKLQEEPEEEQKIEKPALVPVSSSVVKLAINNEGKKKPLTAREFCLRYTNALTIRFAWPPGHKLHNPKSPWGLYYDGSKSPYTIYLDEMRYRGFKGIRINWPGEREIRHEFNDETEKWYVPQEIVDAMKERVQLALDRGYYVTLNSPRPFYANLHREDRHEDRLTDQYLQQHYDMWEQMVTEFKDFSYSVALQPIPEVHMWDYEMKKLESSHPDHMTKEDFEPKFFAFLEEITKILRQIDPKRNVFYSTHWGDAAFYKLPFPFANDTPPYAENVHYGVIENNFGPNAKKWEWWGVDHPKYDEAYLKRQVNKRVEEAIEYLPESNIAYRVSNWASPNIDPPKPGMPNSKVDFKQITDFQCLELSRYTLDVFTQNKFCYEYADLRCEMNLWDNKKLTPHLPGNYHNDKLFRLLMEYQDIRYLKLQQTNGGHIIHKLADPHKGTHIVTIGSVIELEAKADAGYEFAGWTGSVSSRSPKIEVKASNEHGSILANFIKIGSGGMTKDPWDNERKWSVNEVVEYTYVDSSNPKKNFSDAENLLIKNIYNNNLENVKYGVLKFQVKNLPKGAKIAYATITLKAHLNESTRNANFTAYVVSNRWDAKSLTWKSLPKETEKCGSAEFWSRSVQPFDLDVTKQIQLKGNETYSFVIKAHNDKLSPKIKKMDKGAPNKEEGYVVYSSKEFGIYKTQVKPMLYIAWDEEVPVQGKWKLLKEDN